MDSIHVVKEITLIVQKKGALLYLNSILLQTRTSLKKILKKHS